MSAVPEDFSVKARRTPNDLPPGLVPSNVTVPKVEPGLRSAVPGTYDLSNNHSPENQAADLRFHIYGASDSKRHASPPRLYRNPDPFLGNGNHTIKAECFPGSNNNNHHNSNGARDKDSPICQDDFSNQLCTEKYTPSGPGTPPISQSFITHSLLSHGSGSAVAEESPSSFSSFLHEHETHMGLPLTNGMTTSNSSTVAGTPPKLYSDATLDSGQPSTSQRPFVKDTGRSTLSPPEILAGQSSTRQQHNNSSSSSRSESMGPISPYNATATQSLPTLTSSASPSLDYSMNSSAFRPPNATNNQQYQHQQYSSRAPTQFSHQAHHSNPNNAASSAFNKRKVEYNSISSMPSSSSRGSLPSPDELQGSSRPSSSGMPPPLQLSENLEAAGSLTSPSFISTSSYSYQGAARSSYSSSGTGSRSNVPVAPYDCSSSSFSSAPPPLVQNTDNSIQTATNSESTDPQKRVIVPAGKYQHHAYK